MIFVTVGSQKFQFNRLLQYIDELIEDGTITTEVFAQIGASTYEPKHYQFKKFLDMDEFQKNMDASDIVLTHAGTGAIISSLKKKKKTIVVPRDMKYQEHVDNHQYQIAETFSQLNYCLMITNSGELTEALTHLENFNFKKFESQNTHFLNELNKLI